MGECTVTVIGPTGSGKTTYFAALWSLLTSPQIQYSLSIDAKKIVSNKEYLRDISDLWMRIEKIKHTPSNNWHPMEMALRHEATGRELTLQIPDMAGESFENTLEQRLWTTAFTETLEASDSLLLFIGPKMYKAVEFIDHTIIDRLSEEAAPDARAWAPNIKVVPSDVFYTDLLQQVAYYDESKAYSVSIIISAWDRIKVEKRDEMSRLYLKPEEWLALKLPLLNQFIKSQHERFTAKIYGVSAYGRDQEDKDTKQLLLDVEPESRVTIVCEGEESHDITLPIARFFVS